MVPTLAGAVGAWERDVLHLVTCRWHADWLAAPLDFVQTWEIGALFLVLAAGLVALRDPRRGARALLAAALAVGVALSLGTGLWYAVGRDRPGRAYEQVLRTPAELATCASRPEAFALRSHGSKRPSFPSHHALTAGAFALVLTLAWPPLGALAWVFALVVGWARLYFGKHWPTDVLGGLAIGALCGWAAWAAVPPVLRKLGLRRLAEAPPPDAGRRRG